MAGGYRSGVGFAYAHMDCPSYEDEDEDEGEDEDEDSLRTLVRTPGSRSSQLY